MIKLLRSTLQKIFLFMGGFCCLASLAYGQATLTGTVKDDSQSPIIGATVLVQGTTTGTISDASGKYTFQVPAGDLVIAVSYLGYKQEIKNLSVGEGETATLDFILSEDALGLDAIVVTGSFSERSQKNSPMSLTRLNSKQLQVEAFNSQADILRAIPGITAEGGGGEVASNVFVRGMPSGGQYQFTPLQVDGLPTISTFGLNSSAHDVYFRNDIGIRNLEFTKGGASSLFGAGSVAGIINYTSISGTAVPENVFGLEWAEEGRVKADFMSAGPLADDLFYAVSGFYRYDAGPLETGLNTRGFQVRGNLRKLFNEGNSSVTLYGQWIDDNVQFYLPYPLVNNDGDFERPTGNDGETIYTLLTGQATDFAFDTPNGRFESPIENGVITKGGYLMADLQHSFGQDWYFHSKVKVARYDHWFNLFLDGDGTRNVPETQASYLSERSLPNTAAFTYVDNGAALAASDLVFENRVLDRRRPMQEIAGEFNLTKDVDIGNTVHSFTVGTYLSNTRAEDDNWLWRYLGDFSNSPRLINVTYADTSGTVEYATGGFINGSGSQTSNNTLQSSKSAIYFADEIKGDGFGIDIGFRWERAVGFISRETGIGSNTFNKGEVSASDIAVILAGFVKLSNAVNLYANASTGYFFPELRGVRFSAPGTPQSYETERINQAEIGTKIGTKKLAATVAAFFVNLKDRRSIDFVNDGQGGVIEEVSTQDTRTLGLEATVNYQLVKGLGVNAQLTLQDHEFTKVEGNEEQEGNWLRRQPKFKGTFGLNYERYGVDFNASLTVLGRRFANDANTAELDAYSLVRVGGGYTFQLGQNSNTLRLGFSVFNLFNSEGVTEGSPRQGNAQTGTSEFFVGRPILPRRLALRAMFRF